MHEPYGLDFEKITPHALHFYYINRHKTPKDPNDEYLALIEHLKSKNLVQSTLNKIVSDPNLAGFRASQQQKIANILEKIGGAKLEPLHGDNMLLAGIIQGRLKFEGWVKINERVGRLIVKLNEDKITEVEALLKKHNLSLDKL